MIFDTGVIPDVWLTSIVKRISKNKGDPTQPENYHPITLLSCLGFIEFFMHVKLFILFYTDDTVIISESADGLQHALNEFHTYCKRWKLTVNIEKTKVIVFS